jgi:hypothetical protein
MEKLVAVTLKNTCAHQASPFTACQDQVPRYQNTLPADGKQTHTIFLSQLLSL